MWTEQTPQSEFVRAQERGVRQAISILEAAKLEVELSGGAPPSATAKGFGSKIFIVHGRNEAKKHEVARAVAQLTKQEPVILHEQTNGGLTVLEKFEFHAAEAGYAIVIATADDVGRVAIDGVDAPRARQNVIFELGFFFGALRRQRVALLYEEGVERPSDIDGIVRIVLDAAGAWKLQLARELDHVGIGIDWKALR